MFRKNLMGAIALSLGLPSSFSMSDLMSDSMSEKEANKLTGCVNSYDRTFVLSEGLSAAKGVLSALNYPKSAAVCSSLSSLPWFFLSWKIISDRGSLYPFGVSVEAKIQGLILSAGLGIASVASDVYGYCDPNYAVLGNLISKICAFLAGGQMGGWRADREPATRIANVFFVSTFFDTLSSFFAQSKISSIFSGLSSLSWGISAFSWTNQKTHNEFKWKLTRSLLDWVKAAVAGTGAVITNPIIALPLLRKLSDHVPETIPLLNLASKSCAVLAGKCLAEAKHLNKAKETLQKLKAVENKDANDNNNVLD